MPVNDLLPLALGTETRPRLITHLQKCSRLAITSNATQASIQVHILSVQQCGRNLPMRCVISASFTTRVA